MQVLTAHHIRSMLSMLAHVAAPCNRLIANQRAAQEVINTMRQLYFLEHGHRDERAASHHVLNGVCCQPDALAPGNWQHDP